MTNTFLLLPFEYSILKKNTPFFFFSVSMCKAGKFSQSESTEMLAFSMNEEWTSEEREEYETEIEMKEVTAETMMSDLKNETEMTKSFTAETKMIEAKTETEMTKSSMSEVEITDTKTESGMTKFPMIEIEMTDAKIGTGMTGFSTDKTEMTMDTKNDVTDTNIYDNVHLQETDNKGTKRELSEQISYGSSVKETKEKSRVNYLAHLVFFAFFPCWMFVWCCLTLTNQDYEKFVKKTKKKGKK